MIKTTENILLIAAAVILAGVSYAAAEGDFYKEALITGGYSDNDQWIGGNGRGMRNAVGFEYFRKFSDEYGDYMTMDIQMRFAYDDRESGDDAFGLEIHNAWLDFNTGLGSALRVGHFSPAFGLEPLIDTHSSLLQTLAMKNIGFKKDWGLGYRGLLGDFDYQVAAQLGSGMSIMAEDDNYLLSGRISTSQARDKQLGLSVLYGRTLQASEMWTIPKPRLMSNESILKKRVGIDYQTPLWLFDFKTEAAFGEDDGETVGGAMAQIEYTLPEHQRTKLKMQTIYWSDSLEDKDSRDLTLLPVIEHQLSDTTTLRAGYYHDLYSRKDEDKMVVVQLYYYGK
jgi:hypothetical protein